jgi:subtilisin
MGSKRFIGVMSVATVLLMVLAAFAAVPAGAADGEAEKKAVIVGFKGKMDEKLIKSNSGKIDHKLDIANAIATTLTDKAIKALKKNKNVEYVEEDIQFKVSAQSLPWGVDRIDAEIAWGGSDGDTSLPTTGVEYTGDGIDVAVIDTGIDTGHPDLNYKTGNGYDFVNDDNDPKDDNGHGTHVAGTIAALDNTVGYIGVAPKVDLYVLKALNSRGSGYLSDIAAAIDWAVKGPNGVEGDGDDAEVVSMSLGASSTTSTLKTAVDNALAKGTLPVAAAGNDGSSSFHYPAAYSSVVSVSATDSNDGLASFSNYGSWIELAAPGVSIPSTMPTYDVTLTSTGPPPKRYSNNYDTMSGTSMACPHVSGVAALVFEAGPSDDNGQNGIADEVRVILQNTAEDLGATGKDNNYGYGLVDAEAAVDGVSSGAPTVSLTAPTDGSTVSGTITITASASDDDGTVSSVNFYVDNTLIGAGTASSGVWSISWDSSSVSDGTHTIKAEATDNDGNTATDSVSVDVDNIDDKPTASWVNPSNDDTVGGSVTIQISANDDRGISSVEWKVDSEDTWTTATKSGDYYEDTWNTNGLSDGSYQLSTRATDTGSQVSTESKITVTVSNTVVSMYVGSISWKETGPHLKAIVTVNYGSGSVLSGATVSFKMTDGTSTKTYSGTTDASGVVEFQWKRAPNGSYTGTVTGISHNSYTYDSSLDVGNPSTYTK